ncbi:Gfo/Idh/MocA family protein [Demequina sp. NBRC 110057]|uniref:Gfo/Idh/MocA family protein n=1 Tax=Demequina sp. NBRC 110057 TaxID=1570346 RepID=UPI0009FEE9DE|nr:Gfo/Idh/MocA family oxidoreductase [Demequina sp. NBRC 110057]
MARWGIIGTGDISARVLADLKRTPGAEVTAVWGRDEARTQAFAAAHGIEASTVDREAVFARDDVDIVYIATPAHTHRDIAVVALEAGKDVLVEKPMATSAREVQDIFEAAARADRFAMEAMWMRFNPLHVDVRQRVESGEIGTPSSVRASFGTPFFPRPRVQRPEQGGSSLLDRGIYAVTLAHWFLGEPNAVHAQATFVDGVDVRGHATLEHERGFSQISWSSMEFLDLSAAVAGERGWISIDPMFWAGSSAKVHAGSMERIFQSPGPVSHPRVGNGYGPMLASVEDALAAGLRQHPAHDGETTVAVARTLDMILGAATRPTP